MFNVPSFFGFKGSIGGGGGFDTDYQAVLNYATTQGYTLPSAGQQILQNQLVVDLKNAAVWSDLDLFYVFATDGDEDFATINWKDVNNFQATKVNSPNFTTNVGFNSNGSSSYLSSNYVPRSDSTNFQLLSNSLHYYVADNPTNSWHHASRDANDSNAISYGQQVKRHQGSAFSFPNLPIAANSFFSSIRNGTSTEQYIDNTLNRTIINTPLLLPNRPYVVCVINTGATINFGGQAEISFLALGDQIANATMYNAWTTYFSAL
jgi:hypothetical protein